MPARLLFAFALASVAVPAASEVVGHMEPYASLSLRDIERLPPARQQVWRDYLARSAAALARDKAALAAERRPGMAVPPPPPEPARGSGDGMTLDRDASWYASPEARAVAENIVSFQTPAGGWGKHQDRTAPSRVPGQSYFATDLKAGRYEAQDGAGGWSFVGTIDNDATLTELAFLARVQAALPGDAGVPFRAAFEKGIRYLLAAEFPGGGWPQVYPLQGGYHDALTLNDNAMIQVAELLQRVGAGTGDYAFVAPALRAQARAAVKRSIALLLELQVKVRGKPTIWTQQYDPITREPVGARNFEPAALSSAESASVLAFLMRQPASSAAMQQRIADGVHWFEAHALSDVTWAPTTGPAVGRRLEPSPGAAPIWARYYDLETGKPVFGDRDRAIHDDVNEISLERRNGYAWFNRSGETVLKAYAKWQEARQP